MCVCVFFAGEAKLLNKNSSELIIYNGALSFVDPWTRKQTKQYEILIILASEPWKTDSVATSYDIFSDIHGYKIVDYG